MKGQKTGGRKLGTKNRNKANRVWLAELLEKNRPKLEKEFKKLSGRDFCFMYEKLFSYITPKINIESIDFNKLSDADLTKFCNTIADNIDNADDAEILPDDTETTDI